MTTKPPEVEVLEGSGAMVVGMLRLILTVCVVNGKIKSRVVEVPAEFVVLFSGVLRHVSSSCLKIRTNLLDRLRLRSTQGWRTG